jgi:hypothetical protein
MKIDSLFPSTPSAVLRNVEGSSARGSQADTKDLLPLTPLFAP